MKPKHLAIAITLTTGLMTAPVFAACVAPEPPSIPDGNTASGADMFKSKKEMEAYMSAAQSYLDCNKSTLKHNKMVDVMTKVADQFNSSLRQYKAKS